MPKKLIDRTGEQKLNNEGCLMIIIKYINRHNITIEFQDEHKTQIRTQYYNFRNGKIKNPYHPSVYGVGYNGQGVYKTWSNNKMTPQYQEWKEMMRRCYSEKYQDNHPSYKGCTVCKEWHNFQNYAKWYDNNHYQLNNEKIHIDKDILVKDNKTYSPETCIFTPQRINNIFTQRKSARGDLPIGVDRMGNRFRAGLSINSENKHLGICSTPRETFSLYETAKEHYVKQVADEYMAKYPDKFPKKLYDAMYAYVVEITD